MTNNKISNGKEKCNVLLVEDTNSGYIRCKELVGNNYKIILAKDLGEALTVLDTMKDKKISIDAVITNITLARNHGSINHRGELPGEFEGFKVVEEFRKYDPQLPIIVWTKLKGEYSVEGYCIDKDYYITKAREKGANIVLSKYVNDENMSVVLEDLIAKA